MARGQSLQTVGESWDATATNGGKQTGCAWAKMERVTRGELLLSKRRLLTWSQNDDVPKLAARDSLARPHG
jgi:hypothetical protein